MNYEELKLELAKYRPTMTSEERMAAYFQGEEVDHIPLAIGDETFSPLYGYTMSEYRNSFEVRCDVKERIEKDFDCSFPSYVELNLRSIGEAVGSKLAYPENNIEYVVEHVLTDYSMLSELEAKFDPATNPFLQNNISLARKFYEKYGKDGFMGSVVGPLSSASSIRKAELLMRDMIRDKEHVHELLSMCVRCTLKWVKAVCDEFGPISISLSDPMASTTLLSEARFVEFCKPHLADLVKGIKEITGMDTDIHICGRSKALWPHMVDLGFSAFSLDNCESLRELKETVGDKMMISGNVAPVTVLRDGTIDDVIADVQRCLFEGSDSPMGYMLCPGCQIPIGTPMENLQAYVYAARRYGRGAKMGHLCRGLYEEGLA